MTWSVAHRRRALLLGWGLTALLLPGLARLELRTDGHALVPPNDPAVLLDGEIRRHFGLRDPIVVLIESTHEQGIFNTATLKAVTKLTRQISELPGVDPADVASLATERTDRVYPGTLKFRPFLDPLPSNSREMARLRGDLDATDIVYGTLVTRDGKATTILVGAPETIGQRGESDSRALGSREELYRRIVALTVPFERAPNHLRVVGAPVAEALLGTHVLEDLALLLPLALGIITFVLWRGARRWALIGLAGLEILACLGATFGLMGWVGSPVYLTTAVLPVILVTVGLADEIHTYWRHQRNLADDARASHEQLVLRTLREVSRPICLTALTTAVGFLSFLGSSIPAVRSFGLFAAFGVLFCMVWSLTVIPASLAALPRRRVERPPGLQDREAGSGFVRLLEPMLAHPRRLLGALAAVTLVLALGIPRLRVQDSWIDGFAKSSNFRRDTDRANELLLGTHLLLLHLRAEGERPIPAELEGLVKNHGPLLDPARLAAIGTLEKRIRVYPEVGGVLGTHDQLTTVSYLWLARNPEARRIPTDPRRLSMIVERFDTARGEKRRREVIDDDERRTIVTVFLKDANFQDTARLMRAIRADERELLTPLGISLDFAGDVAVSQAMIPAIVRNQVSSVVLAPLSCLLAIALLYGSLSTGFLAVVPASFAVVWVLGGMGWSGMPLGVATSMFCAITLGIAVDYAIHYLERFRALRDEGEKDPALAALHDTGPPIASDVAAIALGFGILAFSRVPANARLGLLVAAALVTGCLLTFAGLAALLCLRTKHQPAP